MFLFLAASLLKVKNSDLRSIPIKLVVCFEADGCNLCKADGGEIATARSQMPQFPPSVSKSCHTVKAFFFLAASLLKEKKLWPFLKDDQFLYDCTIMMWRAWFMCCLWKSFKGYFPKPCVMSAPVAVVTSCQAKLSMLVKQVWCYDVPLTTCQM